MTARPRVVARAEAVGHARRDGDDVLQRAGDLAADHVVVEVDTEGLAGEHRLELVGDVLVGHREDRGRRAAGQDLLGQVGTGEHAVGMTGQDRLDDLGHAEPGVLFEPLDEAHDRDPDGIEPPTSLSVDRKQCEGTPITRASCSACGLKRITSASSTTRTLCPGGQ